MHTASSDSQNGPELVDKRSQLARQILAKLALHMGDKAAHIVVTAFKCQLSCL